MTISFHMPNLFTPRHWAYIEICWQLDLTTTTKKSSPDRSSTRAAEWRRLTYAGASVAAAAVAAAAAAAASTTHDRHLEAAVSSFPRTADAGRQSPSRKTTTTVAPRACFETTVWIHHAHVCSGRGRSSLIGIPWVRARCPSVRPSARPSFCRSVRPSVRQCVSASVGPLQLYARFRRFITLTRARVRARSRFPT